MRWAGPYPQDGSLIFRRWAEVSLPLLMTISATRIFYLTFTYRVISHFMPPIPNVSEKYFHLSLFLFRDYQGSPCFSSG